jgi:pimeloyl-ACP methyl ester carboxylesterase
MTVRDLMSQLAYDRRGTGAALVLLHGIGLSRRSWEPVVPMLSQRFDVVAVDLPGFGASAPLPSGTQPRPEVLATAVAELLDDIGIDAAHLVGNSLGGWVALELAGIRATSSVTLLSPAGLWFPRTPLYCRMSLRLTRWLARHAAGPLSRLVACRAGRIVVLGQSHGRPGHMSKEQARATISDVGGCPGFDATLAATTHRHVSARRVSAPVTVAFGSRDHVLLPSQSRHLEHLPAGARLESLPGCGHVPMYDDPVAVAGLIAASTERGGSSAVDPSSHERRR